MTTRPASEQVTRPRDVAREAAMVGAGTAIPGLIIGAYSGTLRTSTPVLFSLVSGGQCFAIGSTFWTIRSTILSRVQLQNWWNTTRDSPRFLQIEPPSPRERIQASTLAGALTGFSLGFLFRGSKNVIPGTIMFSLFGWGGQKAYNFLDERNSEAVRKESLESEPVVKEERPTIMDRMAKSKWIPLKSLTDEEYEQIMGERLLRVEADIALIEDKIQELRKQQKEMDAQQEKDKK
ncbi:hypothetical protein K458DRAFT_371967 [Lentithecium fluviatile CBS 122367]|uniref:Uncharacterized protein n=1 Tax=Lentithecium fluviatile CBS 122367 TaxID=1168545 RepID=A0A6G1ITF0_9PLEO|nr:hypothetical protein K458DRAFT_371967 [Lentithecium fluviatile CBS 122367]